MYLSKAFFPAFVVCFIALTSTQLFAQSDQEIKARTFGLGQPKTVNELPPGQLKRRLEGLPPQARANALRWLQDFSFPQADVKTLHADDKGNIFYGDTLLPDQADAAASAPAEAEAAPVATLDDAFLLHSRPGAPNTVFIDFDGHTISGTAWNGSISSYNALPYDLDGSSSTFNDTERGRIVDVWHRVSEDLAPFNIDVTTQDPGSYDRYTGHILVTHTIDGAGNNMPSNGGGGVAYVGVFGNSNYHTYYSPALVYYNHLGSGGETYVAEASSHEFGHNLGLSHDGTTSGTTYYQGHGSGLVSWAPIMGNSYYNNVTQWSQGEYTGANQTQNDLSVIDGRLGYAGDDHGNSTASASALEVTGDGTVVSSNPEYDPHNILTENKGIIGSASDVDVFSFVSGAGTINLTITPAWDAFYRSTSRRGANLDIDAELRNVGGSMVTSNDPSDNTSATINTVVSAGTYYLLVSGVGNAVTPYSEYDSLGQFFINGSIPPAAADNTAPDPNPMAFASTPSAISYDAISMTAVTATDDLGSVQYSFNCSAGGAGCAGANSGWQSGTSHTATGLAPSTQYTFTVQARDSSNNATTASGPASATTHAPPPPPAAPSGLTANGASVSAIDLAWTDNASTETSYRVERFDAGAGSYTTIANPGVDANSYTDSGLGVSTSYDYRVAAVNDWGVSAYATASGVTNDPPPYVDYVSSSDTPMSGSVSGTHSATHTDNGSSQSITERESGGKKSNRYTYMEHRWNFSVSSGATVTLNAQAWKSGSNSQESFEFEYSLNNGSSFSPLFILSSTSNGNMESIEIPGAPSGSIIVRATDTHQVAGDRTKSTLSVDHLYIQVGNPPSNPPDGDPGGMTANVVSTSQIDLAWTDGSSNESGFLLERSPASSGPWSEIADLAAGSQSYSDTGLSASTTYYYRVCAHNANGLSGYASANATTDSPPPPPPAPQQPNGLAANGVSTSQINLQWNDNGPNEDGFRIERSPNGSSGWSELATLSANITSYQDTGLPEETTLHYRVVAFNVSGEATSDPASGSTQAAPDLSLTASGYRVKGIHHVSLDWTGDGNVNIYRDGVLQASNVSGGSYDDNIGSKGGASYDHRVCVANTPEGACSNTTTTVF
jgi:hypothetical protein